MFGGGQQVALPALGRRVVDLEHPHPAHQGRAVGGAVEAGAEDDVLAQAAGGQGGQALLGPAAAHGDLGRAPASTMWSPLRRW